MRAAHGEAGWAGERGHGEQGGLSASEEAPAARLQRGGPPDSSVGGPPVQCEQIQVKFPKRAFRAVLDL